MPSQSDATAIPLPCPYCQSKTVTTSATSPYVRGYLIVYSFGYKRFIGCVRCVRREVFKEAGRSMLLGWFSITALISNPFCVVYNVFRGGFLRENPKRARKHLKQAGIPEVAGDADIVQLSYSMATSMITADGKIDEHEIQTAISLGQELFGHFDEEAFRHLVHNHRKLPQPADLARLMCHLLTPDERQQLFDYLDAIAHADQELAPEEAHLLEIIYHHLDLPDTPQKETSTTS
ncbi:TerB family tellurite resistance protein [Pontibacter sp. G13]|uniref:tellurite resistance TerB family protein n=1 Tax=Pontibacter sp. G13 TaxID=3074898 RepID=UPI00288AD4E9|nr:TerB family tellurite resistance protein [Pontibacter sp. G13]WNJ21108.1 TerB family tellurite resistance protein [Pontibacter sp. G13]